MSAILISGIYFVGFSNMSLFQNNINGNFDGFPKKIIMHCFGVDFCVFWRFLPRFIASAN